MTDDGSEKRKKPKDVEVGSMPPISWVDENAVWESLQILYRFAESKASGAINWYYRKKNRKARMSVFLRSTVILLFSLGGLAPILGETNLPPPLGTVDLKTWGYILLAMAGAGLGLDRFFGYSSGWMRYIKTAMAISESLTVFRLDWAIMTARFGSGHPTSEQTQAVLVRFKEFLLQVDKLIQEETTAWIQEFGTSLAELDKRIQADKEGQRPGAVDITIPNGSEAENGFIVKVDGMPVGRGRSTRFSYRPLFPGIHTLALSVEESGKTLETSLSMEVKPGAVTQATLDLPLKKHGPESPGGETALPTSAPAKALNGAAKSSGKDGE